MATKRVFPSQTAHFVFKIPFRFTQIQGFELTLRADELRRLKSRLVNAQDALKLHTNNALEMIINAWFN